MNFPKFNFKMPEMNFKMPKVNKDKLGKLLVGTKKIIKGLNINRTMRNTPSTFVFTLAVTAIIMLTYACFPIGNAILENNVKIAVKRNIEILDKYSDRNNLSAIAEPVFSNIDSFFQVYEPVLINSNIEHYFILESIFRKDLEQRINAFYDTPVSVQNDIKSFYETFPTIDSRAIAKYESIIRTFDKQNPLKVFTTPMPIDLDNTSTEQLNIVDQVLYDFSSYVSIIDGFRHWNKAIYKFDGSFESTGNSRYHRFIPLPNPDAYKQLPGFSSIKKIHILNSLAVYKIDHLIMLFVSLLISSKIVAARKKALVESYNSKCKPIEIQLDEVKGKLNTVDIRLACLMLSRCNSVLEIDSSRKKDIQELLKGLRLKEEDLNIQRDKIESDDSLVESIERQIVQGEILKSKVYSNKQYLQLIETAAEAEAAYQEAYTSLKVHEQSFTDARSLLNDLSRAEISTISQSNQDASSKNESSYTHNRKKGLVRNKSEGKFYYDKAVKLKNTCEENFNKAKYNLERFLNSLSVEKRVELESNYSDYIAFGGAKRIIELKTQLAKAKQDEEATLNSINTDLSSIEDERNRLSAELEAVSKRIASATANKVDLYASLENKDYDVSLTKANDDTATLDDEILQLDVTSKSLQHKVSELEKQLEGFK